jgi:hypothetical protein
MYKMFLGMGAAAPRILAVSAVTVNDYGRDNPAGLDFAQPSGAKVTSARFLRTVGL